MTGVHTRCARTAQGYWFAATVFDAALSRNKQASEYLQHPPIGSLSFGRGVVRGLLDQDQKIERQARSYRSLFTVNPDTGFP